MATKKRRNTQENGLKGLIAILTLVLCGLLILLVIRQNQPQGSLQTDPSTTADTQTAPSQSTPADTDSTPATEAPKSGWITENGKTYFYSNNVPLTGAVTIEGKLYCFDSAGALLSGGWQEVSGSRYYLHEDGSAYSGWLELEDGKYYLRQDGTMARGEEEIDGVRYYFTSAGRHIYVVNPWNYVPEGYNAALKDLPSSIAVSDQRVDASCYDALVQMMKDCMAAGHSVCVLSSYRTQSYQEYLFEKQVAKQEALGYVGEEARTEAAKISAIPGTSEHQLGLAVDIIDTQIWDLTQEQENLAGQQWLMENSWRYGFILRYPKGTTAETGIIYEPWHYRYVGTEVAAELHESGQTLEAYLAALE